MVLLWAATGIALGACSYSQPSKHKAPVREAKPAPVYQGPDVVATREPRAAPPPPVAVEAPPPPAAPAPPPATAPAPAAAAPEPPGVIYFEPDVYRIAPQYRPLLEEHARRLKADPALRLRVEAHADPEGGADYNRALTEKRAETVVKALRALGVDPRQVETRAYGAGGAERADPSDWARYRRVELVMQ
jgi:peptidoglycan-associated lipoprotein